MHPAQIKATLEIAGYSLADLARELEVTRATVSAVVNGRSRSKQVEERIAAVTRLAPEALWPHWYGEKPLVLSGIEREFVLAFRAASSAAQRRALRAVGAVGTEPLDESGNYRVTASHGGIAAGRDVVHGAVHDDPVRRNRKK